MREVRHANADGLDVLAHLVEHLAEILEAGDVRKLLQDFERLRPAHVHVAQRDDVGEAGFVEGFHVIGAAIADADAGELHFFARRRGGA
jgi:hypothetical protein